MAAGAEEPNAIFQIGSTEATTVPNVHATQQMLYPNLVCSATNGWPNVENDLMGTVGKELLAMLDHREIDDRSERAWAAMPGAARLRALELAAGREAAA